jgi:dedicated sortase system histidine kinase
MSLRKQLLFFGLLTLMLPWAAYRYVQEMEEVLRAGLERALIERASTVAAALSRQALLAPAASRDVAAGAAIYAPLLAAAPRIDGSRDDWSLAPGHGGTLESSSRYWSGVYERFVYFVVDVSDESIVYQRRLGEAPYGDRVVLSLRPAGVPAQWLLLSTAAPGVVRAQQTAPPLFIPNAVYDDRIQAAWREIASGFTVELRLPVSAVGDSIGIGVIDVDERDGGFDVSIRSSWDDATLASGRLIYERRDLQDEIAQFVRDGDRYRILDDDGWVVAAAGTVRVDRRLGDGEPILETLLRRILRREDPRYDTLESPVGRVADPALRRVLEGDAVATWYRGNAEQEAVVVATVPLTSSGEVVGALVLERASDAILSATDQALLRLMAITLGAALVVMLGMLAFATYLSYRVRRLARAAEQALSPKGEISATLPGTRAGDEIGDLSRSFTRLLERLRDYTDYLRTLRSKLSHELRTPLAVVTTSLENLQAEEIASNPYLQRLRQGVNRLDAILAAMSEATHIEQAIETTAPERFDLDALVGASAKAYADVYRDRELSHRGLGREAPIDGSPDLVSQLLDKLVDNAVGFSAPGGRVRIELADEAEGYRLAVENTGPLLPATMRTQIFDSLVSVRSEKAGTKRDSPHLGLGLYIAALIARFHGAKIEAANLEDGSGVRVSVLFPRGARPQGRGQATPVPPRPQ